MKICGAHVRKEVLLYVASHSEQVSGGVSILPDPYPNLIPYNINSYPVITVGLTFPNARSVSYILLHHKFNNFMR